MRKNSLGLLPTSGGNGGRRWYFVAVSRWGNGRPEAQRLGGPRKKGLGSFDSGFGFGVGFPSFLFLFSFFLASFAIQNLLCRTSAMLAF